MGYMMSEPGREHASVTQSLILTLWTHYLIVFVYVYKAREVDTIKGTENEKFVWAAGSG